MGMSRKREEGMSSYSGNGYYPYGDGYLDDDGNYYPFDGDEWYDCYGVPHPYTDFIKDGGGDIVFPPSDSGRSRRENHGSYWNQEDREDDFLRKPKSKHSKRKKKMCQIIPMFPKSKSKSKKGKDIDDYDFDEIMLSKERKLNDFKSIWFYRDYHDEYDREEFYTLKEFSDYCQENGFVVSKMVADDIAYWSECHCCVNPNLYKGSMEIVAERDYGSMFYEVCKPSELEGR